ncbi:hypothetical protein [Candidatus Mycolicibacterium alkanivorans]|uniref:Uncharacterized protein n=1 Tax=Candidatus Mycolicibacterium alkanivorans TaxID=2954114 RepID=A0ABS9YV40_9MYCO|nr:hypothetical protein [Candidatus Mycolicibacterium alkanivorans]MCI4674737.1 hypothetical protein [Candidatus Mycolicibacterium alkanivorans]
MTDLLIDGTLAVTGGSGTFATEDQLQRLGRRGRGVGAPKLSAESSLAATGSTAMIVVAPLIRAP